MASSEPALYLSDESVQALSQNMSAIATDFLFWGTTIRYFHVAFHSDYYSIIQGSMSV